MIKYFRHVSIIIMGTVLLGCQNSQPTVQKRAQTTQQSSSFGQNSPALSASPVGAGASGQSGSDGKKPTLEQALQEAPKEDSTLRPFNARYKSAEANLENHPSSVSAQQAYVRATYAYAHDIEYVSSLDPVIRYRAALLLYERALKVEPKDPKCLKEYNLIVSIYQTMGGVPH